MKKGPVMPGFFLVDRGPNRFSSWSQKAIIELVKPRERLRSKRAATAVHYPP